MNRFAPALIAALMCVVATPTSAQTSCECQAARLSSELLLQAQQSDKTFAHLDQSSLAILSVLVGGEDPNFAKSFDRMQRLNRALAGRVDQQPINAALLGASLRPGDLPFANDVLYSTVLGQLYVNPDPRGFNKAQLTLNYVLAASGASQAHPFDLNVFKASRGSQKDVQTYIDYVKTSLAAQSFSAYVLSNHAAGDMEANPVLQQLLNEATSAETATSIHRAPMSDVLRQLLLVEQQNMVLLNQLVRTTKELLVAQAIANALTVRTSATVESQLLQKALGRANDATPADPTSPK